MSLVLEGVDEMVRTLNALDKRMRGNTIRKGLRRAIKPTGRAMLRNVAAHDDTGELADSYFERVSVKQQGTQGLGQVGFTAPHAQLVEYGTQPRFTEAGKYTGIMPPSRYGTKAFEATAEKELDIFGDTVEEELAK